MRAHALSWMLLSAAAASNPAESKAQGPSVPLDCQPSRDRERLATRASPYDSTLIQVGARAAKICYSRPSVRGRVIFGELVPFDTLWRTGADDPTIIHLPFSVEIGGMKLRPGKYSIYTVPGRQHWTIVVNASTSQWGTTLDEGEFKSAYTAEVRAQEVGRAQVTPEPIAAPIEKFTIRSEPKGRDAVDLILEWERTRVRVPLRLIPGSQ